MTTGIRIKGEAIRTGLTDMKTIFITSFEGLETKVLLRTDIVPTLLQAKDVRVVVLTHDAERVAYHKKEFQDPRIMYEVVPRPIVRGLDRIFQKLKFTLLKTHTTDVRRRMKYDDSGRFFAYAAGYLANRLIAHRIGRTLFRFLDYRLIGNHDYDTYFDAYRPSLVVLANIFDEPEVHLLRAAKKRGVPSVGFINSWDKVTARCILRLLPNRCVVFNPIVAEELVRYDHVRAEDIFIGGMPQFDYYVTGKTAPREEFFKRIGANADSRLIVYAPVGKTYGNSDWAMIDFLYRLKKEGKFGKDVEILVRFPPNDFMDMAELEKRPWLLYDHPGYRFSNVRGGDWDLDFKALAHLADTLHHMALLIGFASSIDIDAAVFDKPVVGINFEMEKNLRPMQSPKRYQQMLHCKTILKSGGICFVNTSDELIAAVNAYLRDPSLDREGRKRLVKEQCVCMDGKSGQRIAHFILSLL